MMKKLMAVLLAMMLMMAGGAFAQELALYDFGDFTIEMEDNIAGEQYEKASGQAWFAVYPDYVEEDSFHANLNCIWQEGYYEVSDAEVDDMVEAIAQGIMDEAVNYGIACNQIQILETEKINIDGVNGQKYLLYAEYDYTGLGIDLVMGMYQRIYQLSDLQRGSYTFTLSAVQMEQLEEMDAMIESIRWN